jgi:hypothetical protein
MSKKDSVNPSDAQATTVESQSSVTNTEPIEHTLLKMNVNNHTEKKLNLTYLSWAWAWQIALKTDPKAVYEVIFHQGMPYLDVNGTALVGVSVTLGGSTRVCYLPVMDHRNKAISKPDSFALNTAIQRCMTKCLALFGLGLYIYAGEDLPEDLEPTVQEAPPEKEPGEDSEESLLLFAEGVVTHLALQDTEQAVRSYWKANSEWLGKLKAALPEKHLEVVAAFKERSNKVKEA